MVKIHRMPLPEFKGEKSFTQSAPIVRYDWDSGFHESRPIYPYVFAEAMRDTPAWYRDPGSRCFQVVMVADGEMRYRRDDRIFLLRENRIIIIPQGIDYAYESTRKSYYHKVTLFVLGVNIAAIAETLGFTDIEMFQISKHDEILGNMREIGQMLATATEQTMPDISGKTLAFLSRLAMLKQEPEENSMLFQLAKSRLASNFEKNLKIADLAAELNVSQSTLERMFVKHLKMTPREFRSRSRLEQAKQLLRYDELSIKEISYKLGYCHQFHFTNEFTRLTGQSPAKFRRDNTSVH